jgi:glyoxylase-like metal-dependent hydrolase (beta-lactamase superfamily II)
LTQDSRSPLPDARTDWYALGPQEVAPGIFRLPMSLDMDGLKAVNVYALVGADRVTVIDAGMSLERSEEQLALALDQVGVALAGVTDFLVTHAHRDHYTLAAQLRRTMGGRILMGAAERVNMEVLAVRPRRSVVPQIELLRQAGAHELARRMDGFDDPFDNSVWALPDSWIEDGSAVDVGAGRLRAIHTPGHTRGHMVFLDEERGLLFAGDHVLPHITPSIGFEQVPPRSPLLDYLTSLQLLRSMPDAVLLPGHGPVGGSVHVRVDELLAFHAERLDLTMDALAKGAGTAHEVARYLRWTRRSRRLDEMDDFNVMMAVIETLYHLEVLAERGLVSLMTDDDGILQFHPR